MPFSADINQIILKTKYLFKIKRLLAKQQAILCWPPLSLALPKLLNMQTDLGAIHHLTMVRVVRRFGIL